MRIGSRELRRIIAEAVAVAAEEAALRDYLDGGAAGRLFHVSGGRVRTGEGYPDDPEVPADVEGILRRLVGVSGRGGLSAAALSSRWDEHMAALESGRPVEDRTLFGQGPRRRDPGSAGSGVRAPKTVTVGPGDPATWGGRRPR